MAVPLMLMNDEEYRQTPQFLSDEIASRYGELAKAMSASEKRLQGLQVEETEATRKLFDERMSALEGQSEKLSDMQRIGKQRAGLAAIAIPLSTMFADHRANKAAKKTRRQIEPTFDALAMSESVATTKIGRVGDAINRFSGATPGRTKATGVAAKNATNSSSMNRHGDVALITSRVASRLSDSMERAKLAEGRGKASRDSIQFQAKKVVGGRRVAEKQRGAAMIEAKETYIQNAADAAYNQTMSIANNLVQIASAVITMTGGIPIPGMGGEAAVAAGGTEAAVASSANPMWAINPGFVGP